MKIFAFSFLHKVDYAMVDESGKSLDLLHLGVEEAFFLILNEEIGKKSQCEGYDNPYRKADLREEALEQGNSSLNFSRPLSQVLSIRGKESGMILR